MDTPKLIVDLKACLNEIPRIREIKAGLHHPHVKAWKTKLEDLLQIGGSTCQKTLASLKKIKDAISGDEFIREQTYFNQLEALERSLRQTIQTIEVFGRPKDSEILPHWGKPKSQQLAVGRLMVGDEEVSTDSISIHEVLDCLVSLAEDSNDLTHGMRDTLVQHLRSILDDDLLQPFLTQKIDMLLGHWPEFQVK